ncbi:hypothetical protein ACI8AF_16605 [Blastococcus sp. SYSU D00669]
MDDAAALPPRRDGRRLTRRAALLLGGAGAGALAGAALAPGETRTAAAVPADPPASAATTPPPPSAPAPPTPIPAGLGLLPVEDFRGGGLGDDDAFAAALSHAAAQTHKPAIVFANAAYDLTRRVRPYPGLHLKAFPFGDEFFDGQQITLPAGGLLAFDPEVQSVTLDNLSCRVRDHLLEPIPRDNSRGAWTDVRVHGGGYKGGTTLLEGSFLRLDFQPAYVNDVTDSVVRIGGSDSWLFTRGAHFVSGTLPPERAFLDLHSLGQSVVGSAYVTAQGGYGVRISGSGTGLRLAGTLVDASNRTGARATQLAGVQISGGTDITIDDLWVFNANVSGASRGLVTVTGGSEIVFTAPRFPATNASSTAADTTGACIHTTVPITVVAPKAAGRAKLITASDPDLVTLVGAPGWRVEAA